MSDPVKQKQKDEAEDYVSPTSDETLDERYARVEAEEANLTEAEVAKRLAQLRKKSDLFDWDENE